MFILYYGSEEGIKNRIDLSPFVLYKNLPTPDIFKCYFNKFKVFLDMTVKKTKVSKEKRVI